MSEGGPFDEARGLGDIQAMARRQLSVSLVVGFALLAMAGAAATSGFHANSAEMAGWTKAVATARAAVALPAVEALTP